MKAKARKRSTIKKPQRNPAPAIPKTEKPIIEKARRLARTFHGPAGGGELVRLTGKDRKVPAIGVVLGRVKKIVYVPDPKSSRGYAPWEHTFGDAGPGHKPGKTLPLLVAGITKSGKRRIHLITGKAPTYFSSTRGIVK